MKNVTKLTLLLFVLMTWACSSPAPETPVSELIKKSWFASSVQWDGVIQYSKSGSGNLVAGYSQYKLDLSAAPSVTLTEFDGNRFTGTFTLSSDNKKITLNGLTGANGAPTGTSGTIEFNVSGTPSATTLSLESTTPYIKASNKKVSLSLVNP